MSAVSSAVSTPRVPTPPITLAPTPMSNIIYKDSSGQSVTRGVYIIVRDQFGVPMNIPDGTLSPGLITRCDSFIKTMVTTLENGLYDPGKLECISEKGFHLDGAQFLFPETTKQLWDALSKDICTSVSTILPAADSVSAVVPPLATPRPLPLAAPAQNNARPQVEKLSSSDDDEDENPSSVQQRSQLTATTQVAYPETEVRSKATELIARRRALHHTDSVSRPRTELSDAAMQHLSGALGATQLPTD